VRLGQCDQVSLGVVLPQRGRAVRHLDEHTEAASVVRAAKQRAELVGRFEEIAGVAVPVAEGRSELIDGFGKVAGVGVLERGSPARRVNDSDEAARCVALIARGLVVRIAVLDHVAGGVVAQ
jgi:hypothetical protein